MVFCNIHGDKMFKQYRLSHNPYFNRWFSAILEYILEDEMPSKVTILILIDGFLQYRHGNWNSEDV